MNRVTLGDVLVGTILDALNWFDRFLNTNANNAVDLTFKLIFGLSLMCLLFYVFEHSPIVQNWKEHYAFKKRYDDEQEKEDKNERYAKWRVQHIHTILTTK